MPLQKRRSKSGRKAKGSPPRLTFKPFWRRSSVVLVALVAALAVAVWVWVMMGPVRKAPVAANTPKSPYPTLQELVAMTREQLAGVDIAVMNLRCAEGLRGAEGLDIPATLKVLDRYADHVEKETTRHLYRFRKNPEEFQNSEVYFRMMMMAVVLQEDFKLRYNPKLIAASNEFDLNDGFSDDARNLFIHGLTGPPMMGTCASMPVFYVAIGRRLGYPLYLSSTREHLFARWDDGQTRLNVEGTTTGFGAYPDDHYKSFPAKVTDEEIAANRYLISMNPSDELACFLVSRCEGALTMAQYAHANWCIQQAARLAPKVRGYQQGVRMVQQELTNFRMRQLEQATWSDHHPGQPLPVGLQHPVRPRKINQ
jgi:hypothetical protein